MEVILAIDGGGSHTRSLALDRDGELIGEGMSGPSNHLQVEMKIVRQSLTEAIDKSLISAGVARNQVVCLSAGLAGVDYDGTGAPAMEQVLADLGFSQLIINGDMVIAHAAALGARPGVVALSGTGSSVLGIGVSGERVKIGGWGPIYGDEGSAYRLGEMSLRAAARAYDGRGPATVLTEALTEALGLNDFQETINRVYTTAMEPREIAALSRVAYETAAAGDDVARGIFLRAGEELAESVEAAVRQIELDEIVVSYQGSVVESCHLLRQRFIDHLQQTVPDVVVITPEFEPVFGAYLLGCEALGW